MTESTPELTLLETVAQLAADAATRALLPRLQALEARDAPAPAATAAPAELPEGLASRLDALEHGLRTLIEQPPAPAPLSDADRKTIDDLRLANAENARHVTRLLDKENS